jgi:hypothetical protein
MAYACACDVVCSSASNDNSKTSIEYNAKAVEWDRAKEKSA